MSLYIKADAIIAGGGTGGTAAALALAEMGYCVVITEPTEWIGGQLSSQMVPPDEHRFIEQYGCTARYRRFRESVRKYYRDHYPLRASARLDRHLNPGGGTVSGLCYEPRVGHDVLLQMLAPHFLSGAVRVLSRCTPVEARVAGDSVKSLLVIHTSGQPYELAAPFFLDATELGDLLPLTGGEYVTGAEGQDETGEPHAPSTAEPDNVQGFTWCLPLAFDPATPEGCDRYRIERPATYKRWRDEVPHLAPPWPAPLLSWKQTHPITLETMERPLFPPPYANGLRPLFQYRKIVQNTIYDMETPPHEATLVNWPQNDYFLGNLIDAPAEDAERYLKESRELSLSLVYWLQTEAPRPDGGTGFPGLYLRPDISGTPDGLAMAPYIREARRMRGRFTVTECHIGKQAREGRAAEIFHDSVGIGSYRIDLHPSTNGRNYIDIESLPFQIPLGSLIHRRVTNLLAAGKSASVSHIANGCYRLHPVEWNIGESAGALAAFCLQNNATPEAVHCTPALLESFQASLIAQGVELAWP